MQPIHFHGLHTPRDNHLFLLSMAAMVAFLMALATFVVCWLGGGALAAERLGGNTTLAVLGIGFGLAALCTALTEPHS